MTGSPRDFEAAFFAALLRPTSEAPAWSRQPGFAVHRNTALRGAIDALGANYPTVRRLLGDEGFDDIARAFVVASPPRDGVLARYGIGFASHLAAFAPLAGLEYLPGVAALDRAWTECHLAADAPVLGAGDLAGLTPARFAAGRLVPHPAARGLQFDMPAFTIWRRHREDTALDAEIVWHGEAALLTRPAGDVEWRAAERGDIGLLASCAAGRSCADAFAADGATFDPAASLPALLAAGAFTRFDEARP
jgi:hypothetical protein